MAIQFNTNDTGLTVYTAATAIDAFRLGLMVNPTTMVLMSVELKQINGQM